MNILFNKILSPIKALLNIFGGLSFMLIIAVLLSYVFQGLSSPDSILFPKLTRTLAIILIFLNQGMSLPTDKLLAGLKFWKNYIYIFVYSFIFIPILMQIAILLLPSSFNENLTMGLVFLSILPCTVTSAIIFTSSANANISVSIFATSFCNILAVIIVPFFMLYIEGIASNIGTEYIIKMLIKIFSTVALPIFVGQIIRFLFRAFVEKIKFCFKSANNFLIMYIMFLTFASAFLNKAFSLIDFGSLILLFVIVVFLLGVFAGISFVLTKILFKRNEAIASWYCSHHKALATGVPLAYSIFTPTHYTVALCILPLMFYHLTQSLFGATTSNYLARKKI